MLVPHSKGRSCRAPLAGLLAGVALTTLVVAAPSHAFNPVPAPTVTPDTPSLSATTPSLADVVERVSPSVVQIMVRQSASAQQVAGPDAFEGLPPQFREFFGRDFQFFFGDRRNWQMPDRLGSGSGFFVDGGYIITNNHVVNNASKLRVRFDTGEEVEATLVGTDPKTDLAVIKVDPKHARKPLAWGDSERSRIGDSVFTIGAPFSLGNTVTAGIISARGRDISSGPYDDYFQIDAPINPGNSGGPMFNAAGEVIGVNTAIYSPSGGNVGIGFSIPARQARDVVRQIIDKGYVERGWLGASIQRTTPEIAQSLGHTDAKGVLVAEVTPDSPAARAGLMPMDLITAYGNHSIDSTHDLTRAVAETSPGQSRALKVWRNGQERTLNVVIAASELPAKTTGRPAEKSSAAQATVDAGLGIELADSTKGPVIRAVASGSAAEEAGLRAGDRLVRVDQAMIASIAEAKSAVDKARKGGRSAVLMQIERGGAKLFVGVPLGV